VQHYNKHKDNSPAYWGGKQPRYFDLKEVKNHFNIKI